LKNITNTCEPFRELKNEAIVKVHYSSRPKESVGSQKTNEFCDEYPKDGNRSHEKLTSGFTWNSDAGSKDKKKVDCIRTKMSPIKKSGKQVKYRSRCSSLIRQTMAAKAQSAIEQATKSVNDGINASRAAKRAHIKQVAAEVARIREDWRFEKETASDFFAEADKTRREMLDLRSQIYSKYAQSKVDKDRSDLELRLNDIDKEIEFKSKVFVEHKKKLKENEEKRRRISVAVRTKIRKERKDKECKMQLETIEEQHNKLEHKWAGERDAEEYKKKCEQERRESFAFRNAVGRHQRQEEEERSAAERLAEHQSLEHKWAGERDAEEYKKKCEKERRESLAFRWREHSYHLDVMKELTSIMKEKESESLVLQWAAQDDVKQYLKDQDEERRKSFAWRNQEGKRHRELEETWKSEEIERKNAAEKLKSLCKFLTSQSSPIITGICCEILT
jgi:hypothetical protein